MPEFLNPGQLTDFLSLIGHEDEQFEAKAAANNIPRNAWETVSSFANTSGGIIVFGLTESEDGFVATGVANASKLKQDLQIALRDRHQVSHEVSSSHHIWIENIAGNNVIVMEIPEASRAYKPVHLKGDTTQSYIRRGDADCLCEPHELRRFLRESQPHASDTEVVDFLDFSDLDAGAVRRYRDLCASNHSRHLQGNPDDAEFLTRIGVWRHDRETDRRGLTRGGVLMFGDELAIREIRPNHVIDYIQLDSTDRSARWRDRLRWTQHLFGAWEEIMPRLIRNLPVPFRLSGTTRKDDPAGEESIREALVNLLIHTDYLESSDARITVSGESFWFENPGTSRVPVDSVAYDAPEHFPPSERRNPLLSSLFAHANQAELAGSGVRSMRSAWQNLGYQVPRFRSSVEDYQFSVILSLRSMIGKNDREWLESQGGPFTENEELALLLARHTERVDNQLLRELTGLHRVDATDILQGLKNRGLLQQHGTRKGAFYSHPSAAGSMATSLNAVDLVHTDGTIPHSDYDPPHSGGNLPHNERTSIEREEVLANWDALLLIAESVRNKKRTSPVELRETISTLCKVVPLQRRELVTLLNRSTSTIDRGISFLIEEGTLRHALVPTSHPDQRYMFVPMGTTSKGD